MYDHYNQSNFVQRPRKHGVTRFSLRFSSIKTPSILDFLGQLCAGFQKVKVDDAVIECTQLL